jgi:molecular chaperone DnaK
MAVAGAAPLEGEVTQPVSIGIDLGTSNSCAAAVVGSQPRVLPNAFGERTTASVIAFSEDGRITVGNQAKARIILDPRHTVYSAKRLIGRYFFSEEVRKARAIARYEIAEGPNHSVRVRIREEEFSLPEISAFVLKEIKQLAEAALGHEVPKAVLTVPAYFNDNQRQATKDAGRIAGLEVLRILSEPTAAALAYGYGRDLRQKVCVYDFGGGTFDISILEIGGDVFEVLSTCGDTFLGGDDLDDRIIDTLADDFQAQHGLNVRSDPFAFEKLKAAAEEAKIQLSEHETVHIDIAELASKGGVPIGYSRELSRTEFDKLVADLLQRTFKVCDEAVQQAGLTVRDLDGVILVGGPTRLPTIREAVCEYFGREPDADINPDEVVAIGAALHAQSLLSKQNQTFLLDVTPLSLRVGIAGEMTEPIIERNTPVPIDHTRVFTTARDHQEAVTVRIYQGETRSAEGNELLGEFEFTGFDPAARGEVQIEVTFSITTEGIVTVQARDPKTGVERSTTVKFSSGLSEDEIEQIVQRGRTEDVDREDAPSGPGSTSAPKPLAAAPMAPLGSSNEIEPISLPEEDDEELLLDSDREMSPEPPSEPEDSPFGSIDDLGEISDDDEIL